MQGLAGIPRVAEKGVDALLLEEPLVQQVQQVAPTEEEARQGGKGSRSGQSPDSETPPPTHHKKRKDSAWPDFYRRRQTQQLGWIDFEYFVIPATEWITSYSKQTVRFITTITSTKHFSA